MAYEIEVISIGGDFDAEIDEAAQILNGVQRAFHFHLPPGGLATWGRPHFKMTYRDGDVFKLLQEYLDSAKAGRRFVIGVIDKELTSATRINLFGSRRLPKGGANGVAVVTLRDWDSFTESARQFLCYYMIRYALSFIEPTLRSHRETRDCFFDYKAQKSDIKKSLASGSLCSEHREQLSGAFTHEVQTAFNRMTAAMKSLREDSTEELEAKSLKEHVDIGIITMKPEEHKAVLDRFTRRRKVLGRGSNYSYTRLRTHRNEELRVVIGRTAAQAQGSAQALASSMLADLNPRWLFVVGIAGGVPATEFSLGDVLISQRVHDFSVSAAKEGKPTEYEDLGGPMAPEVEKLVKDLPDWQTELGDWFSEKSIGRARPKVVIPSKPEQKKELLYGPDGWQKDVIDGLKANFSPHKRRQPICLPATFITSNTLVKDTQLVKSWLINARQSLAVEMELAGVMNAARSVGDEKTCVLAVRGISDVVGYKRKPEWTEYACQSGAAFTYALLISGLIRPKKP